MSRQHIQREIVVSNGTNLPNPRFCYTDKRTSWPHLVGGPSEGSEAAAGSASLCENTRGELIMMDSVLYEYSAAARSSRLPGHADAAPASRPSETYNLSLGSRPVLMGSQLESSALAYVPLRSILTSRGVSTGIRATAKEGRRTKEGNVFVERLSVCTNCTKR